MIIFCFQNIPHIIRHELNGNTRASRGLALSRAPASFVLVCIVFMNFPSFASAIIALVARRRALNSARASSLRLGGFSVIARPHGLCRAAWLRHVAP